MSTTEVRLHARADQQWERIVYAEVLIPETPNVYNDYWTKEAVKEFAYGFMRDGFGVDVEHDEVDIIDKVYPVESFIVRPGDPDFIEGAWVIGMKIEDDQLWQDVLDNNINGFSYKALVYFLDATLATLDSGVRTGVTEPVAGGDGHIHSFMVIVGTDNRPISGGTDEVNGHSHTISVHTVTDISGGHSHRFNMVSGKDGQ
jgi:hypothetical protein